MPCKLLSLSLNQARVLIINVELLFISSGGLCLEMLTQLQEERMFCWNEEMGGNVVMPVFLDMINGPLRGHAHVSLQQFRRRKSIY